MTSESKSQSSISGPTCLLPSFSDLFHDTDDQQIMDTNISSNPSHSIDVYSLLTGNMERIKQYLHEIADHSSCTIELRRDGSIVVTPNPREFPNTIISRILKHLSEERQTLIQCSLVNKQFYTINNPILWQLPIHISDSDSYARFLDCVSGPPSYYSLSHPDQANLGHLVRNLCLHNTHWHDQQLVDVLPFIPRLNFLQVITHRISDMGFQQALMRCYHLTSLQLAYTRLTEASFVAIGKHCPQLERLDWDVSSRQSPEWLKSLVVNNKSNAVMGCGGLKRLRITSQSVTLTRSAIAVIQTFDTLRMLSIKITYSNPQLSRLLLRNTIVAKRTTCWPLLTHLTLDPCSDIDDTSFTIFIKTHPYLEHIDLTYASKLTDISLYYMGTFLPQLTYLGIVDNPHFTGANIRRFVQDSPHFLSTVKLSSCRRHVGDQFPESELSFGTAVNLDRKEIQRIQLPKKKGIV